MKKDRPSQSQKLVIQADGTVTVPQGCVATIDGDLSTEAVAVMARNFIRAGSPYVEVILPWQENAEREEEKNSSEIAQLFRELEEATGEKFELVLKSWRILVISK